MRIGILIPHIYSSQAFKRRIFTPLNICVQLADGLVDRGHEVFLYTSGDVESKASIVSGDRRLSDEKLTYYQFRNRDELNKKIITLEARKRDFEEDLNLAAYKDAQSGKLDIIHSFHNFGAHYYSALTKFPTVYTLHDPLPQESNTIEFLRFSKFQNDNYVSISNSQRKSIIPLRFVATVYHGIDLAEYEFDNNPENYLIYFGRILPDKGVGIAIQLALEMNMPLKIATSSDRANMDEYYYKKEVEPYIDGKHIQLVGYLKGKEKSDFIKKAKAFIFPLQWDEPFGMVMPESMACGTPVIAFNRGSVPEIIENGKTGFVVSPNEKLEGLKKALLKINDIHRIDCRKLVEKKFSLDKMVKNYEAVYEKIISHTKVK